MKIFQLKITLGLALGESWLCLRNHRQTLMSTKACFRGKAFLSEPAKITFGENKDVNLWIKFIQQFVCASLGRSLCHGNEHHGIDPNMSNSGHHDCSTKAVFLCTAGKLQYWPMLARNGTYWRMFHISFIGTIASAVLSSSFIRK